MPDCFKNANILLLSWVAFEYVPRLTRTLVFITPQHPNGFYWGHQCSWTFAQANGMEVSNMQSDDCKRK